MTTTVAMMQELEETRQALCDQFATRIEEAVRSLEFFRGEVAGWEIERDDLIREAAPVMTRGRAAACARLSVARIDQILGGAA